METYKYVIVGGGLAGQRACDGIRKVDTGGSVALVAAEPHAPYQQPPLSKGYLVVGGSFIGSEVAASLVQLGLGVTMVFLESRLLEPIAPKELSAWLHARYQANGVRILSDATLESLKGREGVERAVIRDHESHVLEIDLVVMGVGIRLDTELARSAGLEMAEDGGTVVDAHLRTSDPNIYAAGDVAAWPDPTFGKRLRVEHWDVARHLRNQCLVAYLGHGGNN